MMRLLQPYALRAAGRADRSLTNARLAKLRTTATKCFKGTREAGAGVQWSRAMAPATSRYLSPRGQKMPNGNCFLSSRLPSRLRCAIALLIAVSLAVVAQAQTDPAQPPAADPPARVGRISLLSGPVTMTDYRVNEESDAALNWPLTSQQRLSTGSLGRAEVRIGSTSIRMDSDTVVDFNRVDDEVIQVTLQRGTATLRVRNREQLREIDFLTPRERVVFEDVGRYRIDVDRTAGASAVTAHVGSARVVSGNTSFVVQSGQRGEAAAEPMPRFQLVSPAPDVFDDWVAARDHRDDSLQSTRYVSAETTGVESLDEHGEWRSVDSYGAVWFPTRVVADWAPYRYGRWAYVSPWGWTWIDDASWGFTPFHYGRWVHVQNTWGWVPGAYVARPCYAPALVAWYGAPGASVSVSIGGPVGWFPLGPGEVFIPSFYYSRRYINTVNHGHVTNINYITVINQPPNYRYRQPGYSTWAPGDALVRHTPINRVVQQAPNDWAKLPTMQHPPVKLTEDVRRSKQTLVNASEPPRSAPPREIGRRPNEPGREIPGHAPAPRERTIERDAKAEAPNKPPLVKATPNEERVIPPMQRTPRVDVPRAEVPRAETPRAGMPRTDVPRQEAPRGEPAAPARPPKVQPVERAPAAPVGQVGAPPQQIAPRAAPAPRQEAPVQQGAPRAAPAPHQEAPVRKAAPPQHEQNSEHPKPGTRQSDPQRN
jgi:hypothetical protein